MPPGIYPRKSQTLRFESKVNKDGPIPKARPDLGKCWIWTASKEKRGYGIWSPHCSMKTTNAHRYAYTMANGAIPPGLQIDHLCRNHSCVRPSHLEAVTCRTNVLRGIGSAALNVLKTHCPLGHAYTFANTYVSPRNERACRICRRAATAAWKKKVGYSQAKHG